MRKDNQFFGVTKNGENQQFNCYHRNSTGKFVVRFNANNYVPEKSGNKKSQWTGKKLSSFSTKQEAIRAGYLICSALNHPRDVREMKRVVQLRSDFIDSFGAIV